MKRPKNRYQIVINGYPEIYEAYTAGEARALAKKRWRLRRLPPGTQIWREEA